MNTATTPTDKPGFWARVKSTLSTITEYVLAILFVALALTVAVLHWVVPLAMALLIVKLVFGL